MRIGDEIRSMRTRRDWTEAELAERAGLGRMVISRAERGEARIDLDALQRIALAFGRTLTVTFGRDPLEQPADAGHLAMQELILRLARAPGYRTGFELPTRPAEPWRSIDIGLRDDRHRRLLIVECWNTIGDIGGAARSSERKRADAERLASGWWGTDPHGIHLIWVVRDTARNRRLIASYPEVFAARFPGSSRAALGALTGPEAPAPPDAPSLVWSDLHATRLFAWRRRGGPADAAD